ncbi:Pre-mRNA-splicing factor SPF27 [Trichoderma ghanense]|uniref:Pre-mRNA-splicing factor SPF27 n=1 Tax=Trichoderma ghanense TaxID=65468 RepID=A0ABY2HEN1_9HYPO
MAVAPAYHESLPYIDPEPTPEALSAARALVAAEQSISSPPSSTTSSLPPLKEPSFSPAISAQLSRIASSQPPQPPLDLSRYEAQELPPPESSPSTDSETAQATRRALQNAFVSSAYLASRAQNLALLDAHGRNAWLLSNYHLEAELRSLERDLAATKRDIDLVNAARAARQTDVKAEMQGLEQNWREGVGRVLETEIAVQELREQIRHELRSRAATAEPSQS